MKDMQNYFRQNSKVSETEKVGKSFGNWRDKKKTSVTRKKAMAKWRAWSCRVFRSGYVVSIYCKCNGKITEGF